MLASSVAKEFWGKWQTFFLFLALGHSTQGQEDYPAPIILPSNTTPSQFYLGYDLTESGRGGNGNWYNSSYTLLQLSPDKENLSLPDREETSDDGPTDRSQLSYYDLPRPPPPPHVQKRPGGPNGVNNNRQPSASSPTSSSISGDYCWKWFDQLFGCDTSRTILYCLDGRCTCPSGWKLSPGDLPLNTVWHPESKRCVSLLGSGCHVTPSSIGSGYVYCQPGINCDPHPQLREVGTCGASSLNNHIWIKVAFFISLSQLLLAK